MVKTKRKELQEVNDRFSDFSLSSPAHKIRRLDIELPPIVEEDEIDHSIGYEQVMPDIPMSNDGESPLKIPDVEELPTSVSSSDEKAIVLFKPANSYSVTNYTVDPNLIASFKNQSLWGVNMNISAQNDKESDGQDADHGEANLCRAVIPWASSQQLNFGPELLCSQLEMSESMDTEEPGVTTMEFEDTHTSDVGQQGNQFYHLSNINESMSHQWQQQHCLFPQPPQNRLNPVVWYQ